MLPFLAVAIGGALGSVARYAVGLAASAQWGDAFPWGTILINICGSFVIAYVATLTLPDGPLPASPLVRTFVMVGICGGFTTFSSFSLQTLTLLQGGAWAGALANVAISVVCCVGASALGFVAGQRSGVVFPHQASAAVTVLAVLNRPETAHPVLVAAGLLAARLSGSRIDVLHVRHDRLEGFMPTEEVKTDPAPDVSAELRALFDAWPHGANAMWREEAGDIWQHVAAEGAGARLIVLGQPRRRGGEADAAFLAALMQAQAPVLLVPEAAPDTLGRHIAVAWKPSDAAEKALAAAMPLLRQAEQVTVLIGAEDGTPDAPPPLDRVRYETVRFTPGDKTVGAALLAEASARKADLLVMGAYTHGRVEEAVFGGATREIVAEAGMPVLLHH